MEKIRKIIKVSIIIAAVFTALYFCALLLVPRVIDLNKYKDAIAEQIEEQSGFKVSCEDIRLDKSLTPYLKIKMHHTIVLYPDEEIFLKLKDAELKVKILPLLLKRIVIKDAKLTRPIINMTLYNDFTTSFEKYYNPERHINTNGFVIQDTITDTECADYKIKIKDETINREFYLEGKDLMLKSVKLNDSAYIILDGALYQNAQEYLKYQGEIKIPLKYGKNQFKFSPFGTIYETDIKGDVKANLDLTKPGIINGDIDIKNLSIKAEDTLLTNNSINMKFNGEKVKLDAQMHTSEKDFAKIYGQINYGKKKFIDINTNAKNISLKNLNKIITAVTESLNIKNPLTGVSVTGILDADFRINSDLKKLKSSGSIRLINADISCDKLPYKITKINSEINLDNNNVNIEKMQANVNSTPININGVIKENMNVQINASSENLDLKNVIQLFDADKKTEQEIRHGKLSFNTQIEGIINKSLKTKNDINISGMELYDLKRRIPVDVKSLNIKAQVDAKNYKGEIRACGLKSKINKIGIKSEDLLIKFDNKQISVPESRVEIINSVMNISGNINNYQKVPEIKINYNGEINASDIAEIAGEYIKEPYKAKGKIKASGKAEIINNKSAVKMTLKADKDNYLSYMVIRELLNKPSELNIDLVGDNKNINIKEIALYGEQETSKGKEKRKIINVTGGIINGEEPVMKNVKIIIPESLTASTNIFGGEEFSLKGEVTLNDTIKQPKYSGNLVVNSYNIKKYLTSIHNAQISLSPENIRIIAPDIQLNNSKINIIADINPQISAHVTVNNIQMNSTNLDLNSIYEIISKEANPFAQSLITIKKGSATINNFKVLDIKAKDISSDFSMENNILKLKNINSTAYNGAVSGDINYDIPHGSMEIMLNGKNVNMKESLYDLCKLNDNISGTADFNSNISILLGDYETAIKSLNGKIDYTSGNGRMGTLGKFEYYLYAQNILYHGLMNTTLNRIANALSKDSTEHYKTSEGTILFQNGYLITNNVRTIGKDMSLYVVGRHNMLTNQANINIYGRISDEITKKLGSFGDVSLSEIVTGSSKQKNKELMIINKEIINKIPQLYNQGDKDTNTFKVNIFGDISSLNAINSFVWIVAKPDDTVNTEANEEQISQETVNQEEIKEEKEKIQTKEEVKDGEKSGENKDKLPDFSDLVHDL